MLITRRKLAFVYFCCILLQHREQRREQRLSARARIRIQGYWGALAVHGIRQSGRFRRSRRPTANLWRTSESWPRAAVAITTHSLALRLLAFITHLRLPICHLLLFSFTFIFIYRVVERSSTSRLNYLFSLTPYPLHAAGSSVRQQRHPQRDMVHALPYRNLVSATAIAATRN